MKVKITPLGFIMLAAGLFLLGLKAFGIIQAAWWILFLWPFIWVVGVTLLLLLIRAVLWFLLATGDLYQFAKDYWR